MFQNSWWITTKEENDVKYNLLNSSRVNSTWIEKFSVYVAKGGISISSISIWQIYPIDIYFISVYSLWWCFQFLYNVLSKFLFHMDVYPLQHVHITVESKYSVKYIDLWRNFINFNCKLYNACKYTPIVNKGKIRLIYKII